jgi:hypothetical protein
MQWRTSGSGKRSNRRVFTTGDSWAGKQETAFAGSTEKLARRAKTLKQRGWQSWQSGKDVNFAEYSSSSCDDQKSTNKIAFMSASENTPLSGDAVSAGQARSYQDDAAQLTDA